MLHLAIFGDPIAHSLSPRLHAAALEAAGIDGSYEARRVDAAGMEAAIEEIRSGVLDGANVTMPHKVLASSLADELSEAARRSGSVNTLWGRNGRVFGETTDVGGIRRAWGSLPTGVALILGAGGAAAAALLALEGRELFVTARRFDAAAALVDHIDVPAVAVPWGRPVAGAVVVNATPLGMAGEHLPAGILETASGLFDMVYGAVPTPAIARARSLGLTVVAGLEMLLAQAAASFEIWTGRRASIEAMRRAVRL
jgi:shikimate dehydrogenase